MQPKNILTYRITRPLELDCDKLQSNLEEFKFTPCGAQDVAKFGWVPPMGANHSELLYHAMGDWLLIASQTEEKILPKQVVSDALNEKVDAVELEQGRKLKKKEKDAIKEAIVMELMPRAFPRRSVVNTWINTKLNLLFVDASSHSKADNQLALLRKAIGSLPVVPVTTSSPLDLSMTEWVKGEAPLGFTIGDNAQLKSILENGGEINCKQQDLACDEVIALIDSDKLVTSLSLNWKDRIDFVLDEDFAIKRLKFSDELKETNADVEFESIAQRFDADMCLFSGEIAAFLPDLFLALGGLELSQ